MEMVPGCGGWGRCPRSTLTAGAPERGPPHHLQDLSVCGSSAASFEREASVQIEELPRTAAMPPSRGEHLKAVFDDRKEKMYHPMHGAAFALAPSHIDEKVWSDNLWGILGSEEEPENLVDHSPSTGTPIRRSPRRAPAAADRSSPAPASTTRRRAFDSEDDDVPLSQFRPPPRRSPRRAAAAGPSGPPESPRRSPRNSPPSM